MNYLNPDIERYCTAHTTEEPPLLRALNRETHLKFLYPRMLSGHVQGRFLSMVAHLARPRHVLEIGTYTGYSALCFAEGLPPDGHIVTLDINDELQSTAEAFWARAGVANRITMLTGAALDLIPDLPGPFDLVFLDADKEHYSDYYDLVFDKIPSGGFLLADNVLWYGKVLDPAAADRETQGIVAFNEKVQADERVENVLLPLRDGLLLVRKK